MQIITLLVILLIVISLGSLILAILLRKSRRSIESLKKSQGISEQIVTNLRFDISELNERIMDFRNFLESDFKLITTLSHHFANTAYGTLFFFNGGDRKVIEYFLIKMYQRLFEEWTRGSFNTKESFYNLVAFEKKWLTDIYVKKHISQNGNVIDQISSSLKSATRQTENYEELELIYSKWYQWSPIDIDTLTYKWQSDCENKAMEFSKEDFDQIKLEIDRFIEQPSHAIGEFEAMLAAVMKMKLVLHRKLLSKDDKSILHKEFKDTIEPLVERMKSSSTVHQRMSITSQVMLLLEEVNQKNIEIMAV